MKDSYSLDANFEGLDQQYRAHYQAYLNIYNRCALPTVTVNSDVGMMGGQVAHEFMYLNPIGEDTIIFCDACRYTANRQVARFKKPFPEPENALPVEMVATPDCKTISDLANYLQIPESRTAKAVFLIAKMPDDYPVSNQFIFAIVRGDMEVNETKLSNALKAQELRPALKSEILEIGAQPGYASPIGISRVSKGPLPVVVVADDLIPQSPNLVAGANQAGYHLKNVNYGREFIADLVTDITSARNGDPCPECGSTLQSQRGVEVGNIFKLGTRYSEALGCEFLDAEGKSHPVVMGSYGIGSGRLLACIAEEHHDDHGLAWPISVAPYQVHLVMLPGKKGGETVITFAEKLYNELLACGIEVLFDDRLESPGIKFNDAELNWLTNPANHR